MTTPTSPRNPARDGQFQAEGQWIRTAKRLAIYERDNWECAYCGQGPRDKRSHKLAQVVLTLDHLTPKSQGGTNGAENLVTACRSCNSSRQDKPWREFAPGGAIERIEYLIEQPLDMALGKALVESIKGTPELEDK
jgi:hypothetical protein